MTSGSGWAGPFGSLVLITGPNLWALMDVPETATGNVSDQIHALKDTRQRLDRDQCSIHNTSIYYRGNALFGTKIVVDHKTVKAITGKYSLWRQRRSHTAKRYKYNIENIMLYNSKLLGKFCGVPARRDKRKREDKQYSKYKEK